MCSAHDINDQLHIQTIEHGSKAVLETMSDLRSGRACVDFSFLQDAREDVYFLGQQIFADFDSSTSHKLRFKKRTE